MDSMGIPSAHQVIILYELKFRNTFLIMLPNNSCGGLCKGWRAQFEVALKNMILHHGGCVSSASVVDD